MNAKSLGMSAVVGTIALGVVACGGGPVPQLKEAAVNYDAAVSEDNAAAAEQQRLQDNAAERDFNLEQSQQFVPDNLTLDGASSTTTERPMSPEEALQQYLDGNAGRQ